LAFIRRVTEQTANQKGVTWALEHADPGHFRFDQLDGLSELPAWLAAR